LHNIGLKFLLQTNRGGPEGDDIDHHSPGGIVETQDATQLNARRAAAVTRGIASATPEFAVRAQNAEVWDSVGRRYVDFAGGIGVLATGHRHPKVIAAVSAQLEHFTHTAFQVMAYESYIRLAERLNAIAPFKGPAKSLLLTTGVEAVEAAVKIARIATGRTAVIAFSGAFHGRTSLGMALTGRAVPYKRGLDSWLPGIFRVPFPAAHRDISVRDSLRALDLVMRGDVEPSHVAAMIIEPVQGEGGFNVAPPELLVELRRICDMHGILLIADEIQSGFGRTGRMFAIEHAGVEPDLVTLAKSLAGGFPLSAVLGRAAIMDAVEPGGLGGTYGGSPIGCAAALAVLDVMEEERLLERSEAIGTRLRKRLAVLAEGSAGVPIGSVRGLGAMIGFDVLKSRGGGETDGPAAKRVTQRALESGLILLSCGLQGETIRILVPLTIADATLDEGLGKLEQALRL
jgi:4-aminobutyrate aminotransferase / (S)-3-amino-2-methylpropionate transaminase / 5-aminovalerate transaminase